MQDIPVEKFVLFKNVSYSLKGITVCDNIIMQGVGTSVHSYKQYHVLHIYRLSSLSETGGCAAMLQSQECTPGFYLCVLES